MAIRFLCDRHLGKLVTWLRILGYDTLLNSEDTNQFIEKAERERRIVLTRKRDLERYSSGRFVVIRADRMEEQIGEILRRLALNPDPGRRMTLCLRCNAVLENVAKEKVESTVPAQVYQNNLFFRKCPICGRIYWSGTHAKNVERFLRERILKDPL